MLDINRFDEFFTALHPEKFPHPWQRDLVRKVSTTGRWPSLLDLPTGTGKTAAIDIAVFLLALRPEHPRRIVFVVDRRIIVHQAAQRATDIARKLVEATDGILYEVAQALRALAAEVPDEAPPLQCHELRGGIVRDTNWVRRPDVPAVIVSTVDQVGSRLIFRGYGVSRIMRPVHAGLLANDTLFLLDEVHLAKPFADTLGAIEKHYRPMAAGLPNRWQVARLSATPTTVDAAENTEEPFTLTGADREPTCPLAMVLAAHKPARTELVNVRSSDESSQRQSLADACARNVAELFSQGARTIGVVVNRVDTAARIYRQLRGGDIEPHLLTGRMRPLDRDWVLQSVESRVSTGRTPNADDTPLVLVSTQAIEAGADFDFDAIVTECASLDALIQRFGRVDRTGRRSAEGRAFTSVILATSASVKQDVTDPVYGDRLRATWEWLRKRAVRDFGVSHVEIDDDVQAALVVNPKPAPHLLPSHLDRWVQTSQPPDADPDPAHWLHGIRDSDADVTVVWRADVTPAALKPSLLPRLMPLLEACRPSGGEAMSVPVSAVRAWLANRRKHREDVPALSDVESASSELRVGRNHEIAPVISWQGDDSAVLTRSNQIQPGMRLVVPASYGGISARCWDPAASEEVTDLGTLAHLSQRDKLVLRLAPQVIGGGLEPPSPPVVLDDDVEAKQAAVGWVNEYTAQLVKQAASYLGPDQGAQLKSALNQPLRAAIVVKVPTGDGDSDQRMFLVTPKESKRRRTADSGPDTSPFLSARVTLVEHLDDVKKWAQALGAACGLSDDVAADLALAGELHDLGKADLRFQRMLAEDEIGGEQELLAKSVLDADDYATRMRRARLAGYERGTRHELMSVALIQHEASLAERAHDWDLVLHLVASHHGYGRPFFEPGAASGQETVTVSHGGSWLSCASDHGLARFGSGIPARFWRCVRRYGWFNLAWLESILRLADHRASEAAAERPVR